MNVGLQKTVPDLYEQDFMAWIEETIACLRRGDWGKIDVENLIEELDSLGKSQRREIDSRMRVLIAHLLKWVAQPESRSSSWRGTIDEQRFELKRLLKMSPSLERFLTRSINEVFDSARRLAALDTGFDVSNFPATCPFEIERLLDENFWPDDYPVSVRREQ